MAEEHYRQKHYQVKDVNLVAPVPQRAVIKKIHYHECPDEAAQSKHALSLQIPVAVVAGRIYMRCTGDRYQPYNQYADYGKSQRPVQSPQCSVFPNVEHTFLPIPLIFTT